MKKYLLILFLVMTLLVSCATKSTKTAEPIVEDTVPAQVSVFEETSAEEQPSQPEVEDINIVEKEDAEEAIDEAPADEVIPVEEIPSVSEPEEFDWSEFFTPAPSSEDFTWDMPFAEKPAEIEQDSSPEEVIETVEMPASDTPAADTVAETPAFVGPEIPEKQAETESVPVSSKPEVSAPSVASPTIAEASKVDQAKAIIEKVGKFIMKEKLFSFGVLTCIIGVLYLIIALIKTSEARIDKDDDYAMAVRRDNDVEFDDEPQSVDDKSEKASEGKHDTELSNEDDEFLKTLLGENS